MKMEALQHSKSQTPTEHCKNVHLFAYIYNSVNTGSYVVESVASNMPRIELIFLLEECLFVILLKIRKYVGLIFLYLLGH